MYLSQSRVSRLLRDAVKNGIVQTRVIVPAGYYAEIEEALVTNFDLLKVIVVPGAIESEPGNRDVLLRDLGRATADYLSATLEQHDFVGISSWSETLLRMVEESGDNARFRAEGVVQLIGGAGHSAVQVRATKLAEGFGRLASSPIHLLQAPGFVAAEATRKAILGDPSVEDAVSSWARVTVAVAGIGSLAPSDLIFQSGNVVNSQERAELRGLGAVGDVVLRFYDREGNRVITDVDNRVVGIPPEQYLEIPRRIGVAGGKQKHEAILGSVRGGWVNVLITDEASARYLLAQG